MRKRPTNPHDRLFRALVQRPDLGPELVRSCLPQHFAELLADRPIERVPDNIIDQELRLHQCDCLFRFPAIDGNDQDVYALIEHKSAIDWTVPFQVNRYVAVIRDWDIRQRSVSLRRYPLVIPVLLYHGRTKWKGPLSLMQIRKPPVEYLPLFASVDLFLRDLKGIRFEALADHPGGTVGARSAQTQQGRGVSGPGTSVNPVRHTRRQGVGNTGRWLYRECVQPGPRAVRRRLAGNHSRTEEADGNTCKRTNQDRTSRGQGRVAHSDVASPFRSLARECGSTYQGFCFTQCGCMDRHRVGGQVCRRSRGRSGIALIDR